MKSNLKIEIKDRVSEYPWNLENAPIKLTIPAMKLPLWQLERGSAGKIPATAKDLPTDGVLRNIILIPYGCTTLRISEFPIR